MAIKCRWCEETFLTYAALTVHQLLIKGSSQCSNHPDKPKEYDQYVNKVKNTKKSKKKD